MIFKHFCGEPDFVKTVLPSRRELHLEGLRTLKNGIFSMFLWDVFLKPVLNAILDDFGLHLGVYFAAVWIKNRHDFCEDIFKHNFVKHWCPGTPQDKS